MSCKTEMRLILPDKKSITHTMLCPNWQQSCECDREVPNGFRANHRNNEGHCWLTQKHSKPAGPLCCSLMSYFHLFLHTASLTISLGSGKSAFWLDGKWRQLLRCPSQCCWSLYVAVTNTHDPMIHYDIWCHVMQHDTINLWHIQYNTNLKVQCVIGLICDFYMVKSLTYIP